MAFSPRLLLIFAALLLIVPLRPAHAACEPFPKVSLWGNYTHARVTKYVDAKLDGNWSTYVGKLQKRLKSLKAIQARGDVLKLKFRGKRVVLKDAKLKAYVRAATRRVSVAQCLADEADPDNLNNFDTAAGQPDAEPEPAAPRPAQSVAKQSSIVSGRGLELKVLGECRAGVATFKVTNNGGAWPKSGFVSIYRLGDTNPRPISKRRMRFAAGQTSTFRVKSVQGAAGNLALWVNPGWTERAYTEDATLSCG